MEEIVIREAAQADGPALHEIGREALGYPYPLKETEQQLAYVLRHPEHKILVAEAAGRVVGYIHLQDYVALYAPPLKNLLALAVAPGFQRRRVGRALLQAGEAWAKSAGAAGVRVNSGEGRKGAHAFYFAQGYQFTKNQVNLKKLW